MEEVGNPYTAPRTQVQQAMDSRGQVQVQADRGTYRVEAFPGPNGTACGLHLMADSIVVLA